MSVLNDVLKNIDEQKAQQRTQLLSQSIASSVALPSYIPWLLGMMAMAIAILSVKVFFFSGSTIEVPAGLYEFTSEEQTIDEGTDRPSSVERSAPPTVPKQTPKPVPVQQNIVRKTEATEAEEDGIAALKAGKTEQVKKILTKAQPRMRENLNLRVMLKESPEKVVPYLQSNNPDFTSNDELLALAAQAQQRAGVHKMAIVYYQQLIQRQPHEARWLAGLAISLDGLGENDKAKSIYQSVLQTGALPPPLKRFVNYRLKHLGG